MKINVAQIPPEGVSFSEEIPPGELDLDTAIVKFRGTIQVDATIAKITNAVTVDLDISAQMYCVCSRCVNEFERKLRKHLRFNYPVDRTVQTIDLDPDIRQEIILEYPVSPLCTADCKGLCPRCGLNLNEDRCSCGGN